MPEPPSPGRLRVVLVSFCLLCLFALLLTACSPASTRVEGDRVQATHRSEGPSRVDLSVKPRVIPSPAPAADAAEPTRVQVVIIMPQNATDDDATGDTPTPKNTEKTSSKSSNLLRETRDFDGLTGAASAAPVGVSRRHGFVAQLVAVAALATAEPTADQDLTVLAERMAAMAAEYGVEVEFSMQSEGSTDSTLDARGANVAADGDGETDLSGTAIRVPLPWGGEVTGSELGFSADLSTSGAVNFLTILGGLMLAAAVIPVLIAPRSVGSAAILAAGGVIVIACGFLLSEHPWVLVLAAGVIVGILFWLCWGQWRKFSLERTTEATAAAAKKLANEGQLDLTKFVDEIGLQGRVNGAGQRAPKEIERAGRKVGGIDAR